MKTKSYFFVSALAAALVQPAFAACIGDALQIYLKNPQGPNPPGTVLAGTQLALVKIVAVHQDAKPRVPYMEATGTLELSRVESKGSTLPAHFSVPYQDWESGMDCDTWMYFKPKQGERLVAFFRSDGKGWVIPDLPAARVVSDVSKLPPALRAKVQPLFRTQL